MGFTEKVTSKESTVALEGWSFKYGNDIALFAASKMTKTYFHTLEEEQRTTNTASVTGCYFAETEIFGKAIDALAKPIEVSPYRFVTSANIGTTHINIETIREIAPKVPANLIDKLRETYIFEPETEEHSLHFISKDLGLCALLDNSSKLIYDLFPGKKAYIKYYSDPEDADLFFLVLTIYSNLSVNETRKKMSELENELDEIGYLKLDEKLTLSVKFI